MKRHIKIISLLQFIIPISLVILTTAFFTVTEVQAQSGPVIQPDPGDNPLIIQGWLDRSHSLSGDLRLMSNAIVDTFIFLPSDLKRQASNELISRRYVTLAGDTNLLAGVPKDFQVTVSGINMPGMYQGTLTFMLSGQNQAQTLKIPIEVHAQLRPALTLMPGSDQLNLQLVNCTLLLDCSLAKMLLPAGAFTDKRVLDLDNKADEDASVLSSHIVVQGQSTGYQLTSTDITLPKQSQLMTARTMSEMLVAFDRTQLPPDHYTGAIYLSLKDSTDYVKVPINLDVREGPFWPILFLFFGILLGQLTKYMQERGESQAEALLKFKRIKTLIESSNLKDKAHLEEGLKSVGVSIYQGDLANVNTQLETIREQFWTLYHLRAAKDSLAGKKQNLDMKDAMDKIQKAQKRMFNGRDDQAMAIMGEVKEKLTKMGKSSICDPDISKANQHLEAAMHSMNASSDMVQEMNKPKNVMSILRMLKISLWPFPLPPDLGDRILAEGTLYVVRPLLYLVLVVMLTIIGLKTLYVDAGVDFGANPVGNYLGLVLWGLSADVAGRTLGNLMGQAGGAV